MSRTRKIVVGSALAALLLGASALVLPGFFSERHADTAVIPIKDNNVYQDPLLLKKAWQLPVAATYQA